MGIVRDIDLLTGAGRLSCRGGQEEIPFSLDGFMAVRTRRTTGNPFFRQPKPEEIRDPRLGEGIDFVITETPEGNRYASPWAFREDMLSPQEEREVEY